MWSGQREVRLKSSLRKLTIVAAIVEGSLHIGSVKLVKDIGIGSKF